MNINFITSNKGKIQTLKTIFVNKGVFDIEIVPTDLNIIEPQISDIQEISKHKAIQAYDKIKTALVVEDGGLEIYSLGGFPAAYTKYISESIGVDGILKLLTGVDDRRAKFSSWTTFVDENGKIFQFERDAMEFTISEQRSNVTSEFAWSELWEIIYFPEYEKTLSEMTKPELDDYFSKISQKGSLQKFANWFIKTNI